MARAFFSPRAIWTSIELLAARCAARAGDDTGRAVPLRDFLRRPGPFVRLAFRAIHDRRFELQPARPAVVFADKPRTIFRFEWIDELVLSHLGRLVAAAIEPALPACLHSFRAGRSSRAALAGFAAYLHAAPGPVLIAKRDVRRYGESMVHAHVIDDFVRHVSADPRLVELVRRICGFAIAEADGVRVNRTGLPTGTHLQVLFENLYLLDLDRALADQPDSHYVRFGDDFLFATRDRDRFDRATATIAEVIAARGVALKAEKSLDVRLVPPHAPRGGDPAAASAVEHLGLVVHWDARISLPRRKLRRVSRYLRERLTAAARQVAASASPDDRLAAMIACLRDLVRADGPALDTPVPDQVRSVSDDDQLRDLDRWIALEVLRLAFDAGFRRGNFRRMSYRELRRRGLPSVRHLARTRGL